jgi:hypothetical protein
MTFLVRKDAISRVSDSSGYLRSSSALQEIMRISGLILFVFFLSLSFSLGNSRTLHAAPLQAEEFQVKAAFLLNFAKFVEWPAGAQARDSFTIGILGQDPFESALDSLAGKTVRGKRVVVRRYDDPEEAREADILFISASEKRVLRQILKTLRGNSILTVGDSKDFGRSGVMINLLLLNKRVGFEINLAAAHRDGLQISSNLLKLAQEVIE